MKYLIDEKTLTDIADVIRTDTGSDVLISPIDMPSEIQIIIDDKNWLDEQNIELHSENNYLKSDLDDIKVVIENNGVEIPDDTPTAQYAEKVDEVASMSYDKAKSDFWDSVQDNGNRTNYEYGFGYWGCEYIRPKYKVVPRSSRASHMFWNNTKLKKIEAEYFDLSNITKGQTSGSSIAYAFFGCSSLVEIEDVGMPSSYYDRVYNGCNSLKTIAVMRSEATTTHNQSFNGCTALENITIEGEIGRNVSFSPCSKLTVESLKSIITHLANYAGTDSEFTYTLTLHANAWERLEAEGITSPSGTLWRDYIGELGWNAA